jgi:hypothetical protein
MVPWITGELILIKGLLAGPGGIRYPEAGDGVCATHSLILVPATLTSYARGAFRLAILFATVTLYLSIMPKSSSKDKEKTSTVNAAAANFGSKDALASFLGSICGDKIAMKILNDLLTSTTTADDDDDDGDDGDANTINDIIKEIEEAKSQLTEIEHRLVQHDTFIPRLASQPALADAAVREQRKFVALKRSLLALISSSESKLAEHRAALASKAPVKGKKKAHISKASLDDGELPNIPPIPRVWVPTCVPSYMPLRILRRPCLVPSRTPTPSYLQTHLPSYLFSYLGAFGHTYLPSRIPLLPPFFPS